MADHPKESIMEKIADKLHGHDSSSSSDSDNDDKSKPSVIKTKIFRLFGREQPLHKVFGGGKPADLVLWRDKKVSATILGIATAIWVAFELAEYHLLTLVCHCLIFTIAALYVWANAATLIHKSSPHIPEIVIPEDLTVNVARALSFEINRGLIVLREIATGRELKKFLAVIVGLWVLSILGGCCNFLTLFYIGFVLLHSVPVLYEKFEDKIDPFAEKAIAEIQKQYAVFDAKVLSKIPKSALKYKKH